MTDTKTCVLPGCGRQFTRTPGTARSKFALRRYCSRDCGARAHRGPDLTPAPGPKTCPTCNTVFTKTPRASRSEWAARTYCSHACAGTSRRPDPTPVIVDDGDQRWREHALCVDADPELFAEIDRVTPAQLRDIADTARTWCSRCPARVDCGAYADRNQHTGLWGGTYRRGTIGRIRRVDMLEVARRWTA